MRPSVRALLAAAVLAAAPVVVVVAPLTPAVAAQAQEAPAQQTVDRDALRATVPATLAGVRRSNLSATRNRFGDMTIVNVEAQFEGTGERPANLTLSINDYGTTTDWLQALTVTQFDRTDDHGYERTTVIGGFPAIERFQTYGEGEDLSRSGEATVILGDRLHVTFNAQNLTQEQFKAALAELPLAEMAKLVGAEPKADAAQRPAGAAPGGAKVLADTASFREALPATLVGMRRTEVNVTRINMGETQLISGEAQYSADPNDNSRAHASLTVQDWGPMGAQMAPWTMIEIDQDGDQGFERTTKIAGHPALEQYQKDNRSGTVSLLVGGRIIVTFDAYNVTPQQLREMVEGLPLDKLAAGE